MYDYELFEQIKLNKDLLFPGADPEQVDNLIEFLSRLEKRITDLEETVDSPGD